tara:strand:+ start:12880 stop:14481 length:1602 start_codon:yes stop_codon:yes gene_type:complete
MTSDSKVIHKGLPCPQCPSSDAYAVYDDGHGFCYSCEGHVQEDGSATPKSKAKQVEGLIEGITYEALTKRKLSEATLRKWDYGLAEVNGQKVHVANFHDPQGNRIGQKVRTADKVFRTLGDWDKVGLYGEHLWRDGGKRLVVVEGELDALSLSQVQNHRWPVVSVPNGVGSAEKALVKSLEWVESFDEVVFLMDNDEKGLECAQKCALLLSPGKAKIAHLPLKDASEMLQAGRSKELTDATWSGRKFQPDGIVAGAEDLLAHLDKEMPVAKLPFPHSGLTEKCGGFRERELWLFGAGTGAGKSAFVREIANYLAENDCKVGYIALEESVQRSALGMIGLRNNVPLHINPDAMRKADILEEGAKLAEQMVFYDHFGSLDPDNLTAKIRYMVKAEGVTHVFLDHISIVVSGLEGDDRKALDMVMTALRSLVEETNIWLGVVSHLKRPEGKGHEEGGATHVGQFRGSHILGQIADGMIGLERDQQATDESERNHVKVRVLKSRWNGDTGVAGYLRYNPETGRLLEEDVSGMEGCEF